MHGSFEMQMSMQIFECFKLIKWYGNSLVSHQSLSFFSLEKIHLKRPCLSLQSPLWCLCFAWLSLLNKQRFFSSLRHEQRCGSALSPSSERMNKIQISISDACASSWVTRDKTDPASDWLKKRYVDIEQQQVERMWPLSFHSDCGCQLDNSARSNALIVNTHPFKFGGHLFWGKNNFFSENNDWQTWYLL